MLKTLSFHFCLWFAFITNIDSVSRALHHGVSVRCTNLWQGQVENGYFGSSVPSPYPERGCGLVALPLCIHAKKCSFFNRPSLYMGLHKQT